MSAYINSTCGGNGNIVPAAHFGLDTDSTEPSLSKHHVLPPMLTGQPVWWPIRVCICLFLFSLQWAPSIPASFSYLSSLPSTSCLLHQLHHSQIFLFIQSPVLSSRIFKISTRVLEVLLCPVFSTIICLQEVASLDFADIASRDMSAEACRTLAWYVWFPLIPSQHSTWHCDWVSLYLLVGVS